LEKHIGPAENPVEGMNKTNNLHRATDQAKDQVVAAIENAKARAAATAEEIGRATRKTIHDAQEVTEEAWSDARSKAKHLRSEVAVYVREQTVNTILTAVAVGLLLSLLFLFFQMNRK
jgi:ElaB/YqjD/DUF883 family membrane-anchored ribosome-binding protein